jgi:hypothetical protein
LIFIVLGFVLGVIISETIGCTELGCPCNIDGERPCNSCFFDSIFITGILNVLRECRGAEIFTCKNGIQVDSRIDFNNCKIEFQIFGFTKMSWKII